MTSFLRLLAIPLLNNQAFVSKIHLTLFNSAASKLGLLKCALILVSKFPLNFPSKTLLSSE
ncbi:MAG: hypothetical protein LBC61_02360 [Candidatus Peribacteria bacterium]|nr:hypothetical protein [Candidatus Peribacteria bacterium]